MRDIKFNPCTCTIGTEKSECNCFINQMCCTAQCSTGCEQNGRECYIDMESYSLNSDDLLLIKEPSLLRFAELCNIDTDKSVETIVELLLWKILFFQGKLMIYPYGDQTELRSFPIKVTKNYIFWLADHVKDEVTDQQLIILYAGVSCNKSKDDRLYCNCENGCGNDCICRITGNLCDVGCECGKRCRNIVIRLSREDPVSKYVDTIAIDDILTQLDINVVSGKTNKMEIIRDLSAKFFHIRSQIYMIIQLTNSMVDTLLSDVATIQRVREQCFGFRNDIAGDFFIPIISISDNKQKVNSVGPVVTIILKTKSHRVAYKPLCVIQKISRVYSVKSIDDKRI